MIYEFQCSDCFAVSTDYFPMDEAPPIGSEIDCKCGGKAKRIFSQVNLRPEFFEKTFMDVSDKPLHVTSRKDVNTFRRDEYIKSTIGTKLEGTNGKLEYADKYFKQEMKLKEKNRKQARVKSQTDKLAKSVWGKENSDYGK